MPKDLALSRFRTLVDDIAYLYTTARKAQVTFAWETGRRIVEEEQNGDMRAAYGNHLIPKLSEQLSQQFGPGFSERTLADMRRFYQENKILRPAAKLTWTNHTVLMRVKDARVRKALEKRAVKEGLGKYQLRRIVSEVNSASSTPAAPITPLKRPGNLKLDTYQEMDLLTREEGKGKREEENGKRDKNPAQMYEGQSSGPGSSFSPFPVSHSPFTFLDLGFCVSCPVTPDQLATVTVTQTPSYTYAATVERVVDGDTLLVVIEAGFGILVRDKLRLRGINCPELGTSEGEQAKAFVTDVLPKGAVIVLKSSKSGQDKYGRFVVDILYKVGVIDPAEIIQSGTYLNQELLDKGLAVRVM